MIVPKYGPHIKTMFCNLNHTRRLFDPYAPHSEDSGDNDDHDDNDDHELEPNNKLVSTRSVPACRISNILFATFWNPVYHVPYLHDPTPVPVWYTFPAGLLAPNGVGHRLSRLSLTFDNESTQGSLVEILYGLPNLELLTIADWSTGSISDDGDVLALARPRIRQARLNMKRLRRLIIYDFEENWIDKDFLKAPWEAPLKVLRLCWATCADFRDVRSLVERFSGTLCELGLNVNAKRRRRRAAEVRLGYPVPVSSCTPKDRVKRWLLPHLKGFDLVTDHLPLLDGVADSPLQSLTLGGTYKKYRSPGFGAFYDAAQGDPSDGHARVVDNRDRPVRVISTEPPCSYNGDRIQGRHGPCEDYIGSSEFTDDVHI
ncbi:BQ2448_4578 [Microbotryum intermedium]|uniref:BQ2448_4578 protein n=1 Tax=Microbotryum intermedium TaxID=269621 RepID=A0A238FJ21_9BASI|nr:BQ2448_4578 [Microbotryum intermedium]